jgi:DNA repair exonuclease SbcCD ATPase subunit
MIVKITYSVNLEDVPMEVSKLIKDLQEEFKTLSRSLDLASEELEQNSEDVRTPIAKIDHTLKSIEKIQVKLKDCQAILDGYTRVKQQQIIPPPNPII